MGASAGRVKARDLIDFNPITRIAKDGEIPFIEMAALPTDHRYIPEIGRRMPSSSGSKFKDGDTLFARITPCLENGKGGFVSGLGAGIAGQGSTEFIVFRAKDPRDQDFVYYLSRLPEFRLFAEKGMSGTSGRQRVAWQTLAEFTFPNLDPDHRQAMGAILSSLDDKIELNRQMNQTLEAMARAVFWDWFVDFGPTRRKAAGITEPAAILGGLLPPATATPLAPLFPDQFGENGLPLGWDVRAIKENCVQVSNGGTPRRGVEDYWTDGDIPWLTSSEVRQKIVLETKSYITRKGMEQSSAKLIPPESTAVALYGATAGQVTYLAAEVTTNQAVCSLIPKPGFRAYNFLKLSSESAVLLGMATGSAQQNLSKALIENFPVLVANQPIMDALEAILHDWFEMMICHEQENQTLAATRDLLLPKLMSGELRLADVEGGV